MNEEVRENTTHYTWVPPTWTSEFWCKRCGGVRLGYDHYQLAKTGRGATYVECLDCKEMYRVIWHVNDHGRFIIANRWQYVTSQKGRKYHKRVPELTLDDVRRCGNKP
jgi:hypothetical protein